LLNVIKDTKTFITYIIVTDILEIPDPGCRMSDKSVVIKKVPFSGIWYLALLKAGYF